MQKSTAAVIAKDKWREHFTELYEGIDDTRTQEGSEYEVGTILDNLRRNS